MEDSKQVIEYAKKENVKFIKLEFTDFFGNLKSITIPRERLNDAFESGIWFDGSSIEGFARIAESDMFLMPDPKSFARLPWRPKESGVARMVCDVYKPDHKPFEGDPRYILKKAVSEAQKMGYIYNTGPEPEFFLFQSKNGNNNGDYKPVPHDYAGYFDLSPRDLASDVRRDIALALEEMGLYVEASHHEVAPGQHEIDFRYDNAVKTADNVLAFKHATKAIAQMHNLVATFMPKPIPGINGSGMHVHQSLCNKNDGNNAFYSEKDVYNLSDSAKYFVAGQLKYAKEMSAILAPTVNSYKRLVPGYEAPVYICWAQINRSALIRIPRISKGKKQSTRVELRCPDPSCNPYLAFAVMLKTGLEGIKKKMPVPTPVEEDVYHFDKSRLDELKIDSLPGSMIEAISEFKKSQLISEFLGKKFVQRYLDVKKEEWDNYKLQITQWEIDKYLESA